MPSLPALLLPLLLQAPEGVYRGADVDGARLFPRIAYSEAPVGHNRWRRVKLRKTAQQRPENVACPQTGDDTFGGAPYPLQEDCLYMNVWAPPQGEKHPVLLFLHGGGLLSGNGLQDLYRGSVFARRGIVFVSFNYRLSELGYGPKLTREKGALGLMDQANALLWVKERIASFGGDPTNIYLMGHSKGAEAIAALMESGIAGPEVKGGIALSFARHFDVAANASIPKFQQTFQPGERDEPWEKVLERKKDFLVFIPELPSLREEGSPGPRFKLLTSALYDERFWGNASDIYCQQAFFLKQFYSYIDSYFFVWHPGGYEHGAELKALFSEDRFGRPFADYLAGFMKTGEPPRLLLAGRPRPYKESLSVTHLYPWFSLSARFHDEWKGVDCVHPPGIVGSQVSRGFLFLEGLLNRLGYGRLDRAPR